MRLHHVGVAVADLDDAIRRWEALGFRAEGREVVRSEGVTLAFLPAGDARIELLEALDEDGVIARFVARRGEGIHHVAFAVPDLAAAMAEAKGQGFALVDDAPRVGHGGRRVAFLHPRSTGGVLVEFVEEPE